MAKREAIDRATPVVWSDSIGDLVLTFQNLAAAGVRIGAQKDFGLGMTYEWHEWRLTVQFASAPVVGESVDVYLATSDGSEEDGQMGIADAAGTANALANCHYIGSLIVTSTDANHDMTVSGLCQILTRYASPVIHNNTADGLRDTADSCEFTLTPIVRRSP